MNPVDPTPVPEPKSNQDTRGRFVRGNAGGPGNPFARRVAELRKQLLEAVDASALGRLVDALIEKAKNGDVAAARLVFHYALGKPTEAVDPDRVDADELRLLRESAVSVGELADLMSRLPA